MNEWGEKGVRGFSRFSSIWVRTLQLGVTLFTSSEVKIGGQKMSAERAVLLNIRLYSCSVCTVAYYRVLVTCRDWNRIDVVYNSNLTTSGTCRDLRSHRGIYTSLDASAIQVLKIHILENRVQPNRWQLQLCRSQKLKINRHVTH